MLTNEEAFTLLKSAADAAKPFSCVRLGDGEGLLLQYGTTRSREDVNFILDFWFGHSNVTDDQVAELKQLLIESIRSADVVGIPNPGQVRLTPNWAYVATFLEENRADLGEKTFINHEIHLWMQDQSLYSDLLQGREIVVISCRDVQEGLINTLNVKSAEQIFIPEEVRYANDPASVPRHYPDAFEKVLDQIDAYGSDKVYIVGGGVLGKYYCHRIRMNGSTAIDIGSAFDSWVNMRRRRSVTAHRAGF